MNKKITNSVYFVFSVICFCILLTSQAAALQLDARYVKLHCQLDKQLVEKCAQESCHGEPKVSYYGGTYYIDSMHVDIYHGTTSLEPVSGSRRRYTSSDSAEKSLQAICKPDVTSVLQYIKENEFRDDYNDIYPSPNLQVNKFQKLMVGI